MPSGLAISKIECVIWMSAPLGVGSPDGWLCMNLRALARVVEIMEFCRRRWIDGGCNWERFKVLTRDFHVRYAVSLPRRCAPLLKLSSCFLIDLPSWKGGSDGDHP